MFCLVATGQTAADADNAFFRLRAPEDTAITGFSDDGFLTWTNTDPTVTSVVQRATPTIYDWQDYAHVPSTGSQQAAQVYDPSSPPGMAFIPAGTFVMGATTNVGHESNSQERPQHTVYLSAFYMDRYEVTRALWEDVVTWSTNNGYGFDHPGEGKEENHPVHTVNWYDMVKWCNARSEKEGLTPTYYTTPAMTTPYRVGQLDMQSDSVDWNADGYRLPTEAEWEKAARGGPSDHRFPWADSDDIQHARANYRSQTNDMYDTSPTRDFHPTFNDGIQPYSSPAGSFEANAYGLHDMGGNMWEMCWDLFELSYYETSPEISPKGPTNGPNRVQRGGSWVSYAPLVRCANRVGGGPENSAINVGFRCVRNP